MPSGAFLQLDGSIHVLPRTRIAALTFNGVSIIANEPIEVQVWPDGWGFVCVQKQLPGVGAGKVQVDGQDRNYTYWGRVVLTLPI